VFCTLSPSSSPTNKPTATPFIGQPGQNIVISNTLSYVTSDDLPDTYNVAINTSKIISTNVSANLPAIVNVGDVIVIGSVRRGISNTVNVVSGSNVMFGDANSVNFINDLQEGDTIFLSTGNTATVNEVVNVSHAMLSITINVTSTAATINVIYPEVVKVNTVNANTIFTTTQIRGNGNNLLARIEKVR
jgi:preprotein translocase subunit YajC